mgnify:FL=1
MKHYPMLKVWDNNNKYLGMFLPDNLTFRLTHNDQLTDDVFFIHPETRELLLEPVGDKEAKVYPLFPGFKCKIYWGDFIHTNLCKANLNGVIGLVLP